MIFSLTGDLNFGEIDKFQFIGQFEEKLIGFINTKGKREKLEFPQFYFYIP